MRHRIEVCVFGILGTSRAYYYPKYRVNTISSRLTMYKVAARPRMKIFYPTPPTATSWAVVGRRIPNKNSKVCSFFCCCIVSRALNCCSPPSILRILIIVLIVEWSTKDFLPEQFLNRVFINRCANNNAPRSNSGAFAHISSGTPLSTYAEVGSAQRKWCLIQPSATNPRAPVSTQFISCSTGGPRRELLI